MTTNAVPTQPTILGLEFIEIVAQDMEAISSYLQKMGFTLTAKHRRKQVFLFLQGHNKIIVNASDDLTAEAYFNELGISIYALALRCHQAADVYHSVIERGGWDKSNHSGPMEINIPGIEGIGGTSIYFIDQPREKLSVYDIDFIEIDATPSTPQVIESLNAVNFSVETGRAEALSLWLQRLLNLEENGPLIALPDGFQIRFTEDAGDNERCDYINSLSVTRRPEYQGTPLPYLEGAAFGIEE